MNFTLLVAVLLTAIAFGIVIALSNAIALIRYNVQKMEPHECGIHPAVNHGCSFELGYYLFAILFLMFEVETVFLFPWAVSSTRTGSCRTFQYFIFPYYIGSGPCICLEERSVGNGSNEETQNKIHPL